MTEGFSAPYALVAEDHPLVADSLAGSLRACSPHLSVRTAASLAAALAEIAKYGAPALLVTDLNFADAGGSEVLQRLRASAPESRVLVVTATDCPILRQESASLGVTGYILKTASTKLIRDHFLRALTGLNGVSTPQPANPREAVIPNPANDNQLAGLLTSRQLDVMHELAAGRSNKEIASRLHLGGDTVRAHMKEILARLEARNRTAAVVRYFALGGASTSNNR